MRLKFLFFFNPVYSDPKSRKCVGCCVLGWFYRRGQAAFFGKQIKDQDRKGHAQGNRKTDARKWTTSPACPPRSRLKVEPRPQRKNGVYAQVTDETHTFDRYVNLSILYCGMVRQLWTFPCSQGLHVSQNVMGQQLCLMYNLFVCFMIVFSLTRD